MILRCWGNRWRAGWDVCQLCVQALSKKQLQHSAHLQELDKGSYRSGLSWNPPPLSMAGSQEISCTCKASITQLTEQQEDITLISVMNTWSVKNKIADTVGRTHATAVREEHLCLDARSSDQRKPDVGLHFWNIFMH